jgi:hypothetical protein
MAEEAIWLHVPEETFYGSIGTDYPIPRLGEFIRTHDVINIESEGLICLPALEDGASYEKGISLRRKGNMIEVCGISVDLESIGGPSWPRARVFAPRFFRAAPSMIPVSADGADDGDPFADGKGLRSHTMRTVG